MILGNIFQNWNKTCYIAKKTETVEDDYGNEINIYDEPVKYEMNIQPAKGYTDATLYGDKVNKVYKAIVPIKLFNSVHEGDIAYLDGITPENEEAHGRNGNYLVDSVRPQNLAMTIYFKKIDK